MRWSLLVLAFLVGTAAAETPPRIAVDPPNLLVSLSDPLDPSAKLSEITLAEGNNEVAASMVLPFRASAETVAIAFVLQGTETTMSGPSDGTWGDSYTGFRVPLETAFDAIDLGHVMPIGSEGLLVTYADTADIRVPLGPIERLGRTALGADKDYQSKWGNELVHAVEVALGELAKSQAPHKFLIVIGDGNDTNNETAVTRLAELRKKAAADHVSTFALVIRTTGSNDSDVTSSFTTRIAHTASAEALAASLRGLVKRITDHRTLVFPLASFTFKGHLRERAFTLRAGMKTYDPVTVTLADLPDADGEAFLSRGQQIAIVLGFIGLLVAIPRLRI